MTSRLTVIAGLLRRREVDLAVEDPVALEGIRGLVERNDELTRIAVLVEMDVAEDRVLRVCGIDGVGADGLADRGVVATLGCCALAPREDELDAAVRGGAIAGRTHIVLGVVLRRELRLC